MRPSASDLTSTRSSSPSSAAIRFGREGPAAELGLHLPRPSSSSNLPTKAETRIKWRNAQCRRKMGYACLFRGCVRPGREGLPAVAGRSVRTHGTDPDLKERGTVVDLVLACLGAQPRDPPGPRSRCWWLLARCSCCWFCCDGRRSGREGPVVPSLELQVG